MRITKFIAVSMLTIAMPLTAQADAATGKRVFDESCTGCHTGGIKGWITGAPALGDKEEWAPLIAEGVEHLTENTVKGTDSMPAKGGCEDCSEADIAAAVGYLVSQSQ